MVDVRRDEWDRQPTAVFDGEPVEALKARAERAGRAYLLGISGPVVGQRYIVGSQVVIGRETGVDIRSPSHDVSRQHARIIRTGGGEYVLEDLGGVNGTFVNGQAVKMQVLRFGDTVQAGGETSFIFTHHNPVQDELIATGRLEGASELASGMSHHFNNAMTVIVSSLTYIKDLPHDTRLDNAEVQGCLADLEAAIWRGSSVVRQMNSFARQGKCTIDRVDISALLTDAVRRMRDRSCAPAIDAEIAPDLHVCADATELHEVLNNLCTNALEAIDGGGALRIAAQRRSLQPKERAQSRSALGPGAHVVITITDSGAGMDEETRRQAFDPFFTTKDPGRGLGLGLPAAFGVISNHGGHVRLESAVGQGTTCTIYLTASAAVSVVSSDEQW